jgi:excisionase family DNA binding protein
MALPSGELYTPAEIAAHLQVRVESVRRWTREGLLPCVKAGRRNTRVTREALEQFLAARPQKVEPEAPATTPPADTAQAERERIIRTLASGGRRASVIADLLQLQLDEVERVLAEDSRGD